MLAVEMWSETEESRRQATEEGSAAGTLESLFFAIWLSVRQRRVAAYRGTAAVEEKPTARTKSLCRKQPADAMCKHARTAEDGGSENAAMAVADGFEAPLPLC